LTAQYTQNFADNPDWRFTVSMDPLVRQGSGFTQQVTSDNPDSPHQMPKHGYEWTDRGFALATQWSPVAGGLSCQWQPTRLVLPAKVKKGDQWRQVSKRTCTAEEGFGGSGKYTESAVVVSIQSWASPDVGTIPTATIRRTIDAETTYPGAPGGGDPEVIHEERTDIIALEGAFAIQSDITTTQRSAQGSPTRVKKVRLLSVTWR